jgi:hypothetical protein
MTVESQIDLVTSPSASLQPEDLVSSIAPICESKPDDPILCPHCLRTVSNGIKCKGLCVADSNY